MSRLKCRRYLAVVDVLMACDNKHVSGYYSYWAVLDMLLLCEDKAELKSNVCSIWSSTVS